MPGNACQEGLSNTELLVARTPGLADGAANFFLGQDGFSAMHGHDQSASLWGKDLPTVSFADAVRPTVETEQKNKQLSITTDAHRRLGL
jgi:hypothetical protein